MPARQSSCPAFVGPDASHIAVTSAWKGMDAAARATDPDGGKTFLLDVEVRGRFEPRVVQAGDTAGDLVEVLSGVEAGEHVVVRASFLVDSESRLKAALAALSSKAATPKAHGRGVKP